MIKLKTKDIKVTRESILKRQHGLCAICQLPLGTAPPLDPVLDHDHSTGAIRAVLHRCCNSVLGKIENGSKRYGVPDIIRFTSGVTNYLTNHSINRTDLIHPTYGIKRRRKKRKLKIIK